MFQYVVSLDQGRFASMTIKGVSLEDSGRYTMIVQNKYGGESVDIVVSVAALQRRGGEWHHRQHRAQTACLAHKSDLTYSRKASFQHITRGFQGQQKHVNTAFLVSSPRSVCIVKGRRSPRPNQP